MSIAAIRPALRRPLPGVTTTISISVRPSNNFFTPSTTKRSLSSRAILPSLQSHSQRITSSKLSLLAATPPPTTTSTPSSFFTPSLCRQKRNASTTATSQSQSSPPSDPTPSTAAGTQNPPPSSVVLDWNSFFRLRTSRRRYSLASSVLGSMASFSGCVVLLSTQPELADQFTKILLPDPFISMGLVTFGAALLGWLIGPIFGNGIWRLLHRARLPEFTIKERAFFERIKKHRVNPAGASTNNPVPDYYGEKVGSVGGYRRWLKDQRAFNRKRSGSFVQ